MKNALKPLIALLLLSSFGCTAAPPAQRFPRPVGGTSAPQGEEFDPQSLQEDLLLIQPNFPPPVAAAPVVAPPPQTQTPVPDQTLAPIITQFRVQLLALSNKSVAYRHAVELAQHLDEPVYLVEEEGFFAVRAGSFSTFEAAEVLRQELADLQTDYQDAYVTDRHQTEHSTVLVRPNTPGWAFPTPIDGSGEPAKGPGWRILLDQFLELEEAEDFRQRAIVRLGRQDIDITFQAPYYRVLLGHFTLTQKQEAEELVERIRRRFPNALKVRGEILLPQEER